MWILLIISFPLIIICGAIWILCPKKSEIYEVFLYDMYYDQMTDNDELEDIPTIVRVKYNSKGKILDIDFADSTSDLCDNESSAERKMHFYSTCNIKPGEYEKYTIYGK